MHRQRTLNKHRIELVVEAGKNNLHTAAEIGSIGDSAA